jgi:hypothetical protein
LATDKNYTGTAKNGKKVGNTVTWSSNPDTARTIENRSSKILVAVLQIFFSWSLMVVQIKMGRLL